jgi:hypothetical protein
MARIAKKLTDLIGNTPLLELNRYESRHEVKARILCRSDKRLSNHPDHAGNDEPGAARNVVAESANSASTKIR